MNRIMVALVFLGIALACETALGQTPASSPFARPEPSEWMMLLSGLGLVALGLSRKPRAQLSVMPAAEEKDAPLGV